MFPEKSSRNKSSAFPNQVNSSDKLNFSDIELTNQQLFELVHQHDKFSVMVNQLIGVSQKKIDENEAAESIQYLTEAERILEYAASCGKNIDRKIIMAVLHNQAYAYQRMWELYICSNYLEALIYNINEKMIQPDSNRQSIIKQNEKTDETSSNFQTKNVEEQFSSFKLSIGQRVRLIKYHLQFSAVNSQLKYHNKSVQSGQKALKYMKQLFFFAQKTMQLHFQMNYPVLINRNDTALTYQSVKILIDNLLLLNDKPKIELYESYLTVCKHLYQIWANRIDGICYQVRDELLNTTIGSIMQIKSFTNQIRDTERTKLRNMDYLIESSEQNYTFDRILQFIVITCISYFTLSTELRLNSLSKIKLDRSPVSSSISIEAEIYHLICLSLYFIYIPFKIDFLQHVLNSYHNHYSGDLKGQVISKNNTPTKNTESTKGYEIHDEGYRQVMKYLDPLSISQWIYQRKCPNKNDIELPLSPKKKYDKLQSSKTSFKNIGLRNSSSNDKQIQKRYKKIITQRCKQKQSLRESFYRQSKKKSLNNSKKKYSFDKLGKSATKHNKNNRSNKKNNKNEESIYQYKILDCLEKSDEMQNKGTKVKSTDPDPKKSLKHHPSKSKSKETFKTMSKKVILKKLKPSSSKEKEPDLLSTRMQYQLDYGDKKKIDQKKQMTPKRNYLKYK